MNGKRVVVAMSGGVDSSTAAAILKKRGFEVIGLSMQLWDYSKDDPARPEKEGSCCTLEDIQDARKVADSIGIPFYVVNMEEAFKKEVVDYFVSSYLLGSTPNPCVKCNEVVKFKFLLKKALLLGADYLATGHYARVVKTDDGYSLLSGLDGAKDQSYFLFTMTQEELKRTLFPLGGLTKSEVRLEASRFGLRVAEKKESQEICFIEDGSYSDFVSASCAAQKGDIVTSGSKKVGSHSGVFRYTVGQRKGLDIKDGAGPYYVISIDAQNNRVVVGKEDELFSKGCLFGDVNWINKAPAQDEKVTARIRYRHPGVEVVISPHDVGEVAAWEAVFKTPEKAVTPGQAIVFYRGDTVLGGGWIKKAIR